MKNYCVKQYKEDDYSNWNSFIVEAKNATFLFHRDFMEYHKDRFEDFSLLIYDNRKLVAVLPANRVGEVIHSHQGLTYGGLVYNERLKLATILQIFRSVLIYLNENKMERLTLKIIPSFYNNYYSEEVEYALFLVQAKLIRRDTCAVIELQKKIKVAKGRAEGINKGKKLGLIVKEESNFEVFWNQILIPNLDIVHQAKPIHSLQEIKSLHQKFPKNNRQFNVYSNGKLVAGTTIFESKNVAHSQYICGNEEKGILGSIDFLYDHLLTSVFHEKHYFDFGISNINQGKNLNEGLSYWKESFGANIAVQDFYEVETSNYYLLENVLV